MTSILGVPVDAAYHLVSGFTSFLTPALGGVAAVAAIVLFTVAARLILMPLSLRGLRGQAAQARLAPQLQALRKRYAKQPERLQREMTELYKREGTSLFAGLTPFLLQWPLLSVMYLLFRSTQIGGKANTLLTRDLFGVPLGSHWLAAAGPLSLHAGATAPGALIKVLPYLTVVIAAFVPLAAGIYLLVSTAWALAERAFFWRTGRISGAAPSPPKPVLAARD